MAAYTLCTKIFGSFVCKKLLSHILPAIYSYTNRILNNPIYSLVKRESADIINRSSFLPNLSTVSFQNSQNNQFPVIFYALYLLTAMTIHAQLALWLQTV